LKPDEYYGVSVGSLPVTPFWCVKAVASGIRPSDQRITQVVIADSGGPFLGFFFFPAEQSFMMMMIFFS